MPEDEAYDQDEQAAEQEPQARAFTFKSLAFGILGLLFTIVYTVINDVYLKQTSFIANHLPPGPTFLVIALALIWNPIWYSRVVLWAVGGIVSLLLACYAHFVLEHSLLFSWHLLPILLTIGFGLKPVWESVGPSLRLNGRELILSLIIITVGSWTAGAGLNYFFSTTQVGMWTVYSNNVQMQNVETIDYIPEHLWPAGGLKNLSEEEKLRIYESYKTGSEQQGFEGVPWDAWLPSVLGSWIPLFVLFAACLIAISLIVHRQWSHHEQLAYPIAQIGSTLFEKEQSRALPNLFYDKKFWIAALIVIAFHGTRYLHAWFPNNFPSIATSTYFNFLLDIFPTLKKSGIYQVHWFNFFFSIIGITYFLSREIGLSIGIAPFLLAAFSAQLYISTGTKVGGDDHGSMRVGAYIAYAAVILYTGRNYYWPVFKKAITMKAAEQFEKDGVFAARILMVSFVGLILVLTVLFGLELPLAILFTLTGLLLFLVFTRIICETGIPYLQAAWDPGVAVVKFLGVSSVGAAPIVLLYYISSMLFCDPKEAMMPFVSNGLKMAEDNRMKLKKLIITIMVIVGAAVFISIGVRLYQQYTMGGNNLHYTWADHNVPSIILGNATRDLSHLEDLGQRAAPGESHSLGFFQRIGAIDPNGRHLSFALVGVAGVILFFFLRFRYTGFPLHPVFFLIWGITPNARTFYSFLIGWMIRELIVRFGGGKVYQEMKPFFIGLIFAELFMGVVGMSVGFMYSAFTDFTERPPSFRVILG